MKKRSITILIMFMLLIAVGLTLVPEITHAEKKEAAGVAWTILGGPLISSMNTFIANLLDMVLKIFSILVYLSGVFLSYSINITLDMAKIFGGMPSLGETWIVIRNITSMFVIFMLLFESLKTILGVGSPELSKLVINIFIAGVLINFSLFFAKLAIDASNLVSLQFYRAIAPTSSQTKDAALKWSDGDISAVFMNSLKIQKVHKEKSALGGTQVAIGIIVSRVLAIAMMLTAAISFTAAAVMFTARTAILFFCMVLSPIYFAAIIFPQAKKKSDELFGIFMGQLTFMPIYLFLMYIALRLISSDGFNGMFDKEAFPTNDAEGSIISSTLIATVIQYMIALIFINAPLVVAVAAGGVGGGWAVKMTDGMNGWLKKRPGAIGGWAGAGASGAWRNTGGRIASKVADSDWMKDRGNSFVGKIALQNIRGVAGSYDSAQKKKTEERVKYGESLGYNKDVVYRHEETLMNQQELLIKTDEKIGVLNRFLKQKSLPISVRNDYEKELKDLNRVREELIPKISKEKADIAKEKSRRQTAQAEYLDPTLDQTTGVRGPQTIMGYVRNAVYTSAHNEDAASELGAKTLENAIKENKTLLEDLKKKQGEIKKDVEKTTAEIKKADKPSATLLTYLNEREKDLRETIIGNPTKGILSTAEIEEKIRNQEYLLKKLRNK